MQRFSVKIKDSEEAPAQAASYRGSPRTGNQLYRQPEHRQPVIVIEAARAQATSYRASPKELEQALSALQICRISYFFALSIVRPQLFTKARKINIAALRLIPRAQSETSCGDCLRHFVTAANPTCSVNAQQPRYVLYTKIVAGNTTSMCRGLIKHTYSAK